MLTNERDGWRSTEQRVAAAICDESTIDTIELVDVIVGEIMRARAIYYERQRLLAVARAQESTGVGDLAVTSAALVRHDATGICLGELVRPSHNGNGARVWA